MDSNLELYTIQKRNNGVTVIENFSNLMITTTNKDLSKTLHKISSKGFEGLTPKFLLKKCG